MVYYAKESPEEKERDRIKGQKNVKMIFFVSLQEAKGVRKEKLREEKRSCICIILLNDGEDS